MPYKISKVDGYKVTSPHGIKAKSTSLRKAMAQRRLLEGVKRGWKPTGKPSNLAMKKHVMKRRAGK